MLESSAGVFPAIPSSSKRTAPQVTHQYIIGTVTDTVSFDATLSPRGIHTRGGLFIFHLDKHPLIWYNERKGIGPPSPL
jgi:hypothetical protein